MTATTSALRSTLISTSGASGLGRTPEDPGERPGKEFRPAVSLASFRLVPHVMLVYKCTGKGR